VFIEPIVGVEHGFPPSTGFMRCPALGAVSMSRWSDIAADQSLRYL
jgi:hypothetical protein